MRQRAPRQGGTKTAALALSVHGPTCATLPFKQRHEWRKFNSVAE